MAHRLYLRMTVHERLQHAVLAISFILLVITGFMLRYPGSVVGGGHPRASAAVRSSRGASSTGWPAWCSSPRACGMRATSAFTPKGRRLFLDLLPRWRDLTDPWKVLRYNLGFAPEKPKFGRFSYMEKAEYWALIWGTLLMGATGVILWFENTSMGLLTKLGFDISRTVHFYEAILATLAILVWHFYFVIFNPDIYPMNLAWLTGRVSEREMRGGSSARARAAEAGGCDSLRRTPPRSASDQPGESDGEPVRP